MMNERLQSHWEVRVGQLHEAVKKIEDIIEIKGLDPHETKGLIGMKAGFFLIIIKPDTPDDPEKLASLRDAAEAVLGQPMPF
jgi:hypothetical protein